MPPLVLDPDQLRELDRRAIRELGIPGIVLMENAGREAVRTLLSLGAKGPFVVCCGKGGNGGDGFVMARHLDQEGLDAEVVLFAHPSQVSGDAATYLHALERSGIPLTFAGGSSADSSLESRLAAAEWIVDGLLGTGAVGEPQPAIARAICLINAAARPVFAIDVPSGFDCRTGRPASAAVRARHTCTFVAAKPGFFAEGAAPFVGTLHVVGIGLPRRFVAAFAAGVGSA
jgi:NAD(P)H-hydrate epimerase